MLKVAGLERPFLRAPTASELMRVVNAESREWAPSVVRAAQRRAPDAVSRAVAASGTVKPVNYGVEVVFGGRGSLRAGVPLKVVARPYEFGTTRQNVKTEVRSRSPKGRAYRYMRRTQRQLPHASDGRFIYPAVADTVPELTSRLVAAILRTVVPDARQ